MASKRAIECEDKPAKKRVCKQKQSEQSEAQESASGISEQQQSTLQRQDAVVTGGKNRGR